MLYRNIVKLFELFKHVLALLPHWQHPGSLCGHPDIIQTPTDTLQTPRNSPPILVEMGHWEQVEYVEIKIPTQLFSIVLALIYSRHSPEGPGHPTGGVGGPMVADEVTKMDTKMVIKSIFRELKLVAVMMILLVID